MVGFFMVLFIILCFMLMGLVLIQQGKGDLGLGGVSASGQMLFGGSGGQDVLERATWIIGFLFIGGALGIAILKSRQQVSSQLQGFRPRVTIPIKQGSTSIAGDQTQDQSETKKE